MSTHSTALRKRIVEAVLIKINVVKIIAGPSQNTLFTYIAQSFISERESSAVCAAYNR